MIFFHKVQYQLIFCLWVLTFNPLLASKMNKFSVIPILADILNDCAKEKVSNQPIIFTSLCNIAKYLTFCNI